MAFSVMAATEETVAMASDMARRVVPMGTFSDGVAGLGVAAVPMTSLVASLDSDAVEDLQRVRRRRGCVER